MIDVMIVDDESVILKGIRTSIDWESKGIRIVGEASNGKEGLSKALILLPHIVITDIRMPIMDGLKLTEELRNKLPSVKVVVLSGYDDFEYARKALRFGAKEYLLKPIGAEDLIAIIEKLGVEIKEEQIKKAEKISSNIIFNESLPLIQSQFMARILKTFYEREKEKILKEARTLNIDLSGPQYQVVLINIDNFLLLTQYSNDNDKEMLKYSVMNISEEIFKSSATATVCYSEFNCIAALLNLSGDSRNKILAACKEIQFCIKKYLQLTVTIGTGNIYNKIEDISKSYSEAMDAIQCKIYKGNDRIISINEVKEEKNFKSTTLFPNEEEMEIINCLSTLDRTNLTSTLEKFFKKLVIMRTGDEMLKGQCIKLVLLALRQLEIMGINYEKVTSKPFSPYSEINKYETIEYIEMWLKITFYDFIKVIEDNKDEKFKGIVKNAIKYMQEHFSEDLNISDVAKTVFVTPNYLSRLFKEEVGKNYVDWLNKYRIEKARCLIRENPGAKTYEIAERVGFNNYKYFVIIFKRYTSLTPKEFKENNNLM